MADRNRQILESLAALSAEAASRRETDPLAQFEPFPKQRDFIDAILTGVNREAYYIGANRSGKSDAGAFIGATLARYGFPEGHPNAAKWAKGKDSGIQVRDRATSGWVSALDYRTSQEVLQPKYFDNGFVPAGAGHGPFIPSHEIDEWRISDQILKLKNGSMIGFRSAEAGRAKYMGAGKDWIHFDEEHSESIYQEATMRVEAGRTLVVFTTCTLLPPEGQMGGISWLFDKVIKPWKAGKLTDVGIYNASIYDNPYLHPDEIKAMESRFPEGSVQRRIRLEGELVGGLTGARVYSGFDPRLNVRDQPEIQLRRPLAWTWDFNVEPMVSLIGQKERNLFRVFRELVLPEGNIGEMCELFRSIHPVHMAEIWIFGDATGKDRSHHSNRSSYQIIMNAMMGYPAPLRLKVPERNPSQPDRINAMNRAFKNEAGEVCFECDPSCEELVADFEQVVSDGKQGIRKTYNKAHAYFWRTHASDAASYWIAYEAPVKQMRAEFERPRVRIRNPMYGMA